MNKDLIFYQLFEKETSTYTYLLADRKSKEAIIIDPVIETVERDYTLIQELGLNLKYILDTHVHADHITASGELRNKTGAKVALSQAYPTSCPDIALTDGQELQFGDKVIKALSTPGHTNGCMTYVVDNMAFTGDALLIKGCGRTDFQEGSSDKLFDSVRTKIFQLNEDTLIYPGHDYKGHTHSTVGMEKKFNPRLKMDNSKEQFVKIMADLKLDYPKKIQEAVPANLHCGLIDSILKFSTLEEGLPAISAESFHAGANKAMLIDVRRDDEFNGELGHIAGAKLVTLGPQLESTLSELPKDQDIIFICRSGRRSLDATKQALSVGLTRVYNLTGGMLRWNELKYPVVYK